MKKQDLILPILFLCLLAAGFYFLLQDNGRVFEFAKSAPSASFSLSPSATPNPDWQTSPLSGLPCADASRRPIAVMLSSDAAARPLSGISEADLVFEMPVVTDSITRLMAVFVCGNPKELGSVRSARHDYIPLARGLDAIFAHWGGSHFALEKLGAGIMDNLDALKNPFNVFYRKSGIVAPHNGFTSLSRLISAAQNLGYRLEGKEKGYSHFTPQENVFAQKDKKTLTIGYPGAFEVKYEYNPADNSYLRWRGGLKEIDKNTGEQIAAKNIALMRAPSRQIEGQYNDVQIEGEGKAAIYRDGEEIQGIWKKDGKNQTSKLYFYDTQGQEIKFVPGQIWIEVVEPNQQVRWE